MFTNALSVMGSSETYEILLPLALILLCAKLFSLLGKKIGLPQVVGMLVAGILLGLLKLIPDQTIFTEDTLKGLSFLAKIGVILIMFSAGIETDLKQFKTCGIPSVVITILGVVVPMGLGFIVATAFNGGFERAGEFAIQNLFYGTILSATSVSITVAALKELGKLNSKVGTSIITAAILDDIIGVILLSLFISLDKGTGASEVGIVIGKMIGFFAAAAVVGVGLHFLINRIQKWRPHTRRLPIIGFAVCFFFAYAAEKWFGVALGQPHLHRRHALHSLFCYGSYKQILTEKVLIAPFFQKRSAVVYVMIHRSDKRNSLSCRKHVGGVKERKQPVSEPQKLLRDAFHTRIEPRLLAPRLVIRMQAVDRREYSELKPP